MKLQVCGNKAELGARASANAIQTVREALVRNGLASIVVATGTSQFDLLQNLSASKDIDWSRVVMFHLDEYIDLPETHPASFRKYLKERFISKLPALKACYLIDGDATDPAKECERLNQLILNHRIDLALVGIGENGHLAFNDPPADFETKDPFIIVNLDDACKKQQVGEGWFKNIDEVPNRAISMSIHQILASEKIVCSVPGKQKARPVRDCLQGPVTPLHPASALTNHDACIVYLDPDSASLLTPMPS